MDNRAPFYVYVIGKDTEDFEAPVKIGMSSDPWVRAKELQVGCPFTIKVLHAEPMRSRKQALLWESGLHELFAEWNLIGEWYRVELQEILSYLEGAIKIDEQAEKYQRERTAVHVALT